MGTQLPSPKRGPIPQFSAHFCCGQTAGCIKMPLGVEVGLSPRNFVLDEHPAPVPKRGRSPQFSAHVYCGQTAGWIKMALGMEVSLGPGHIVPDGDPATLPQKEAEPQFSAHFYCGQTAGCIKDVTKYGGRHRPRRHCVRWAPSYPPKKGAQPPIFGQCPLWPNGWIMDGLRCHLVWR